jgi:hypothetical protein
MRTIRTVLPILLILVVGTALLAAPAGAQDRPTRIKITAEQANLREKPDIGSSIVQQIPEGVVVEADRKDGEWYFVRYTLEDGGVIGGWIHESLVEVVEAGTIARVEKEKQKEQEAAPARRRGRPIRIGKIERPELSTGGIPLEFGFSAGLGYVAPRDLNRGTRGYADWTAAEHDVAAPPAAGVLHIAYLLGFEVTYRVSPRLAVGLGADYMRAANKDRTEYEDPAFTATLVTSPAARTVPFKLLARYYPGAGFYVRGGLGIYSVKASYLYRLELPDSAGWRQLKGEASGGGLGGEAAFGGEWEIAPRTVFFAEAGVRMARFGKLTGTNTTTHLTGQVATEPGTLFYVSRVAGDGNTYPLVYVAASAPVDAADSRRAVVDLSGTAVRAGVRYRF